MGYTTKFTGTVAPLESVVYPRLDEKVSVTTLSAGSRVRVQPYTSRSHVMGEWAGRAGVLVEVEDNEGALNAGVLLDGETASTRFCLDELRLEAEGVQERVDYCLERRRLALQVVDDMEAEVSRLSAARMVRGA